MLHFFARSQLARLSLLAAAALMLSACGDDEASDGTGGSGSGGSGSGGSGGGEPGLQTTFGGDRPVELFVPSTYDENTPAPLLILLHGLNVSGQIQEILFNYGPVAEERGILYAHPDGTVNNSGAKFWNATELCCDFQGTGVDDAGYLDGLIDEISAVYNVDPKRIYFSGHSNGHFMSYRMACDHSDRIAAIAGLAGASFEDHANCNATSPVNILHIHGTADDLVPFDPAATLSIENWSGHNGCDPTPVAGPSIDLESGKDGNETDVSIYENCDAGGATELWAINDGGHIPNLSPTYAEAVIDWLLAHPKP